MFDFDTLIQDVIREHDKHDTFLDDELDDVLLTDDEHDTTEPEDSLFAAIDRAGDVYWHA